MTIIRPGTIDDASFMHALDGLVPGRPRKKEWYEEALRAGEALVAMLDTVPAGFAVHHRHFFDRDFLSLLVVEPWCRRRGVASTLLTAVEAKCADGSLFTSTNESNGAMRAALRTWGFRPTGRIDNIDPGDPELVFLKRIGDGTKAQRGL